MKTTMLKKTVQSIFIFIFLFSFSSSAQKLVSNQTHIKFFSTTPAEDIESNNYATTSTLDTEKGAIVFSVPMQSFEFEKSLMQKHFNQKKFLNTKEHPTAKLTGEITDIEKVDFSQDGTYDVNVKGDLTIRGVTQSINEKGTIVIKNGKATANSKFFVTLADYGVEFSSGKPSKNIADKVEVTVLAEYPLSK
ncbi:MAG: YceI family protein [Bacteroidales bacterium]